MFAAISEGRAERLALVPPVFVPAIVSEVVAISTLPATVVLAFGCVEPAEITDHVPAIYWKFSPRVES